MAVSRAAVLGASGFAGGELVRLLHEHPSFEVIFLGGVDSVGRRSRRASRIWWVFRRRDCRSRVGPAAIRRPPTSSSRRCPTGAPRPRARAARCGRARDRPRGRLPPRRSRVSGVVRLRSPGAGVAREGRLRAARAVRRSDPGAPLVANPGCFATPAILGCVPLLAAGLIEPGVIRVDGKTGVSGAGRAATESTSSRRPRTPSAPTASRGTSTPRRSSGGWRCDRPATSPFSSSPTWCPRCAVS